MLDGHGDLAAAELAFFAPAFLISAFVCFRHGFGRQLGWFYITVLSLLRIIGSSCTLYMEANNNYSAGLQETAAITSSVGTAPLLLALMGFLKRINDGMDHKGLGQKTFQPIQLISLASLIIAIVGGVKESDSDPSDQATGRDLMKAAAVLFLVIWLALSAITILTITKIRWVLQAERKLIYAATAYTVAVGFSNPGEAFYFRNVNVWAQAFMMFLMEAIVVSLYVLAGLMTPKYEPRELREGAKDIEGQSMDTQRHHSEPRAIEMETGFVRESAQQPPRYQQAPREHQQRSLGDYRPSRMIINAIRDRN